MEDVAVKLKNRFISRVGPTTYFFRSGKAAHFVNGIYLTDIDEEIRELEHEIKLGHPVIATELGLEKVDTQAPDFLAQAQAKAAAEAREAYKQELIASGVLKEDKDMGTGAQAPLNVASTASINKAAGSSNSSDGAPANIAALTSLASLKVK